MKCVKGTRRGMPVCFTHNDWPDSDACLRSRVAELDADLRETLRAVLHHFGPDGAHKVTTTTLDLKSKRSS